MLLRHRVACWIVGYQGIAQQLMRYAPVGDRALGIDDDPEYRGWRSHLTVMSWLANARRLYPAVHGRATSSPDRAAG